MTPIAFLPKIRSETLRRACGDMPCTMRIASFVGLQCSGDVVGVHLDGIVTPFGKGMGSKSCDLGSMVAGCAQCHALLDRTDHRYKVLEAKYPVAVLDRLHGARSETMARWIEAGLVEVRNMETV